MPEDKKLDVLSGGGTPIELMSLDNSAEMISDLTKSLVSFLYGDTPEEKRIEEFLKNGFSPSDISQKINNILKEYKLVPDEGRTLEDVVNGATKEEIEKIKSITSKSKELFDVTNFFNLMTGTTFADRLSDEQKSLLKGLEVKTNELMDFSVDVGTGKLDFDRKSLSEKYPSIIKNPENDTIADELIETTKVIEDPDNKVLTKQGGPSLSKGYLQKGEYVSDDYDPSGDEAGYTGKAKKTGVSGKTFNPNDPTTYKWQYELKGQRQNDGTLVPGTENELYYVDAGEVDEDAYKKFEEPTTPAPAPTQVDVEKDKKMGIELGNVITALKAGAGLIGLGKAMKDLPIGENQELSDSFKAYMQKTKELADSGLTAQEKASIKNDLSNAYNLGAKNVLRASAGSRGTFLSNMGMLNANRVNSLIKMGEIDAKMQRENMANYGNMLTFQEKFKADQGTVGREMAYKESLRKSNLYGGIGSSLIGSAISDLTAAEQMKKMTPYMNQWAKNMGLTTTATNTESDAQDDAKSSITTG